MTDKSDWATLANKAFDFATTQFTTVVDATKAILPTATKAVLWTVSIDCLQNLVIGGACFIAPMFLIHYAKKNWKSGMADIKIEKQKSYGNRNDEVGNGRIILAFLLFVGSVILSIIAAVNLLDVWNWVGVVHPDLYLVHQAIQKVLAPAVPK